MEKKEASCTAGGNVNWGSRYGKQYGSFLKTKNRTICDPVITGSSNYCDPVIPLQGVYLEKTKAPIQKDTCTSMFLLLLLLLLSRVSRV